jgi:trans-aconitate 2-methyltransferase
MAVERAIVATWDPGQYLRFADARSRPFFDLVAQIGVLDPEVVVDIGCGTGSLTATLASRWPAAAIVGLDSSPSMIERAALLATDRLRFTIGDATAWVAEGPVDVLVSNATLHWIEGHDQLAARWISTLRPQGWLAFQVPGNFRSPSHVLIGELLASPHWRSYFGEGTEIEARSFDPTHYVEVLTAAGASVDAWETTYLHLLTGPDPVLEWLKGTTLRPILDAFGDDDARAQFLDELGELLRAAYPPGPAGTVFPFRRVFVVAQRR